MGLGVSPGCHWLFWIIRLYIYIFLHFTFGALMFQTQLCWGHLHQAAQVTAQSAGCPTLGRLRLTLCRLCLGKKVTCEVFKLEAASHRFPGPMGFAFTPPQVTELERMHRFTGGRGGSTVSNPKRLRGEFCCLLRGSPDHLCFSYSICLKSQQCK